MSWIQDLNQPSSLTCWSEYIKFYMWAHIRYWSRAFQCLGGCELASRTERINQALESAKKRTRARSERAKTSIKKGIQRRIR